MASKKPGEHSSEAWPSGQSPVLGTFSWSLVNRCHNLACHRAGYASYWIMSDRCRACELTCGIEEARGALL